MATTRGSYYDRQQKHDRFHICFPQILPVASNAEYNVISWNLIDAMHLYCYYFLDIAFGSRDKGMLGAGLNKR